MSLTPSCRAHPSATVLTLTPVGAVATASDTSVPIPAPRNDVALSCVNAPPPEPRFIKPSKPALLVELTSIDWPYQPDQFVLDDSKDHDTAPDDRIHPTTSVIGSATFSVSPCSSVAPLLFVPGVFSFPFSNVKPEPATAPPTFPVTWLIFQMPGASEYRLFSPRRTQSGSAPTTCCGWV